jgi:hypothetical protein
MVILLKLKGLKMGVFELKFRIIVDYWVLNMCIQLNFLIIL